MESKFIGKAIIDGKKVKLMLRKNNTEIIINDFNQFKCKHEKIYSVKEWIKNDYNDEYITKGVLFIIHAEYMVADDEELSQVSINYELCYGGSKQFNKWLKKHNLHFEWYNSCIGQIYKNK